MEGLTASYLAERGSETQCLHPERGREGETEKSELGNRTYKRGCKENGHVNPADVPTNRDVKKGGKLSVKSRNRAEEQSVRWKSRCTESDFPS